jgi:LmbE family N-acetylglucosaminyl deacetylase
MNPSDRRPGAGGRGGWRRFLFAAAFCVAMAISQSTRAAETPEGMSTTDILLQLRSVRETRSVLYIGAHPDDENNRLLAYLARGQALRTAYLSLTRGDGGQNLIGSEQGSELGVIRTQELLAARRVDGAQQFFTRAIDFGFSKDYRETFNIWDRQQVLSDIVRVIRTFRPDVIINRFSTTPGGTHGHHTASGILGLEAFKLAGDPKAFPEQLESLAPWQPKRIFLNVGGFGREPDQEPGVVRIDSGGYQPLMGESFGEIAAESRSMHKSQGMGGVASRGGGGAENFHVLDGAPATNDLFDGIDLSWRRFGNEQIGPALDEIIARFKPMEPAESVPALFRVLGMMATLPDNPTVRFKIRQLNKVIQGCLGLYVETVVAHAEVVPGESLRMRHTAIVRSGAPVRWKEIRYGKEAVKVDMDLPNNRLVVVPKERELPAGTPVSQPYWLRKPGTPGLFHVDDPRLIGLAEDPPVFPIEMEFEVNGLTLSIEDSPVEVERDPVKGEVRRQLTVIPPVSLRFVDEVQLFQPGSSGVANVELTAARAGATGTLALKLPEGWLATPAAPPFLLTNSGDKARFAFTIVAPKEAQTAQITAVAHIGETEYSNQRIEIRHDHIPFELLQPPAQLKALSIDLAVRGKQVGYIPGAGDHVAECLGRMGYSVTMLGGTDLTAERLKMFDAIVVGVRAFNVRADLGPAMPALFDYVQNGGTLVEQYNTPRGPLNARLAPYDLNLSGGRVTDETAPMTFLAADHPALTVPNRISQADFEGWVQERGLYFPDEWDAHFTAILACHDPGEKDLKGSLLVAKYGNGYFVYTGLAFFRQLPEGVPGAYRLFANLVSLGK